MTTAFSDIRFELDKKKFIMICEEINMDGRGAKLIREVGLYYEQTGELVTKASIPISEFMKDSDKGIAKFKEKLINQYKKLKK